MTTAQGMGLNAEQLEAVEHTDVPLRLIAGAGTGKTRTLTERIAHIVRRGKAEPGEILALTFTEKAATEMAERIHAATRHLSRQLVHVDTYNAFGGKVVEEHGYLLGLPPGLRVLTPSESWIVLWRAIQHDEIRFQSLDLFGLQGWNSPIAKVLDLNSRLKDELVSREDLEDYGTALDDSGEIEDIAHAIEVYQEKLRELGAIDFGDQIALAVELLRKPEVAQVYAQRYKYILVDEFQDTNYAQSVMVKLLAQFHRNVCVVGDPYQAIYGFRGAAPDNIDRFVRDFPESVTRTLTQNYRSTQGILDVANSVWSDAGNGLREDLVSAEDKRGPRVVSAVLPDRGQEIEYIASEIRRLQEAKEYAYGDMAILVRKNDLKIQLWRRLRDLGIPVEVVGGSDLFRTPEVREVIAYLRALDDPSDTASLAHALTSRVWGYDEAQFLPLAREAGWEKPLLQVLAERAATEPEGGLARRFLAVFDRLATLRARASLPRLIEEVISLRRTCYSELEEANVRRLKGFAYDFAANQVERVDLTDLLNYIDLVLAAGSDEDEAQELGATDTVKLMTAHAAKGLEWPVVFVATANNADFRTTQLRADALPAELGHAPAGRPDPSDTEAFKRWRREQQDLEDRRVFYVALTRARDRLYVTRSKLPTHYKKERPPLEFFERAQELCDRHEPEESGDTRIVVPLRSFAEEHIAGVSFEPDPEPVLKEAWTAFARAWRLPEPERTIGEALHAFREGVRRWDRWIQDWERRGEARSIEEPKSHKGRPSLSYTQLSTFESCNRRYHLRYIQGLPGLPEGWKTKTGSAFHAAIERHARLRMQGYDVPFEQVLGWFRAGTEGGGGSFSAGGEEGALQSYWQGPDARARVLAVEEEFYLPVGDSYIHGFIDRVQQLPDGRIEIVDYKTNRRAKTEEEVRADLQLPIYVTACREVLDLRVDIATMYFVRHNKRISIQYTEGELEEVREWLEKLASEIETIDPARVNTSHCKWCEFRLACSYSTARAKVSHVP